MDAIVPVLIIVLVLAGLAYFVYYHIWPDGRGVCCTKCGKPLGDRTEWIAGLTEYRCVDCKPSGRVDIARNIYQTGEDKDG